MTPLGSPLQDRRSAFLLVGVLAVAVYANSLGNQFAYDDVHIVVNNSDIQSWETLPGALIRPYWPFQAGQALGLWRPVTTAAFGLQYMAGGGSPLLFHAVNVAAHAAASLLVLALLLELMSPAAALVGGVLFAVHPVHVESVANVVGFAELASTAAILAACLLHVRGGPSTAWGRAMLIGLLYAVGFGAKESAVTLPGLIFLLDAARERIAVADLRGYVRRRWRLYVTLALVAVGMLAARYTVLGRIASPLGPLGGDLLYEIPRIWTLAEVWLHYVRLWVLPLDLSSDYSPDVIPISLGWHAANTVGVLLSLSILVLAMYAWRRRAMAKGVDTSRAAAFGVIWFVIAISPISNTLFLSGVLLAERTLYLPSVGLAAATGWLFVRMAQSRPTAIRVAFVAVVFLAAVRSWTRNPVWHDNQTNLSALVRDYPQAGRSQAVIGDLLIIRGQLSEGLRSYRLAINVLGNDYQVLTQLSKRLVEIEYFRTAEALLRAAAREHPEHALAHGLLAAVLAERGDAPGTEHYARISLGLEARDPVRHHLLAWSLAAQGRFAEAGEARARGLEQGEALLWQRHMYEAYRHRSLGDSGAALIAVDSAWTRASTDVGRRAVDSVRVAEFGLKSRLGTDDSTAENGLWH